MFIAAAVVVVVAVVFVVPRALVIETIAVVFLKKGFQKKVFTTCWRLSRLNTPTFWLETTILVAGF